MTSFAEFTNDHDVRADEEKEESFAYAMQLAMSSVLPMAMKAATELDVFDIIAKSGPGAKLSASDITAQIPTQNIDAPKMLDRILRLLASHSVLGCSVVGSERLYNLTPVSNHFVRDQDGVSLGPLMEIVQDKVFLDSWSQFKNSVIEGGFSFDRVNGSHAFEYLALDSRFNQLFNTGMFNHTTIVIKNILQVYKGFGDHIKQLVDVGGGVGVTIKAITSKYLHIKGINFDLPHVIEHAPQYPGVEHVGGDMFESVPKGDAIFLKWILHDWSDEHCLKLLKNCYKSVPQDGKVIVVEAILPVMVESSAAAKGTAQIDVHMMTQTTGGKERNREEFMALAIGAGFSGIRYKCFVCNISVMEFYK